MVDTQLRPQNPEALTTRNKGTLPFAKPHVLGKSLCHCLDGTPALQMQTRRFPATGNRTAPMRDSDPQLRLRQWVWLGNGSCPCSRYQRNEVCVAWKLGVISAI
jgi:hypothetical protein